MGAIVALAPETKALTDTLGVDTKALLQALNSWGPGRYDAILTKDGRAFRPDKNSSAVLIPPALGLAGVNLSTSTGWGSLTYWNAYVANLEIEMYGKRTFFDPRLNNRERFPIAAKADLGNVGNEEDHVTPELAALHYYQLAIPAPRAPNARSMARRPSPARSFSAARRSAPWAKSPRKEGLIEYLKSL